VRFSILFVGAIFVTYEQYVPTTPKSLIATVLYNYDLDNDRPVTKRHSIDHPVESTGLSVTPPLLRFPSVAIALKGAASISPESALSTNCPSDIGSKPSLVINPALV
jgi:hypothetical protein